MGCNMLDYLTRIQDLSGDKTPIAYDYLRPADKNKPVVVFLPGFRSDMMGTKALFLADMCLKNGYGCLRLDYSGHGQSSGEFEDGSIGVWLEDALAVVDAVLDRPCYVVGSSMGGWIALLMALARPDMVAGVVGIAAAPDFTRDVLAQLTPAQKTDLAGQGYFEVETPYDDRPYCFTKRLLDEGETHCLLDRPISLSMPVTLIQGMEDSDVDWHKSVRLAQLITPSCARLLLIEKGDHRLSRTEDLKLLRREILQMVRSSAVCSVGSTATGHPDMDHDQDDPHPEELSQKDVRCFIRTGAL